MIAKILRVLRALTDDDGQHAELNVDGAGALWTRNSGPSAFTLLSASDATDITAAASRGLLVTVTGDVYVQGASDPGITSLGTIAAGTLIPGRFVRFGASSSATAVGLGG